jgi:hypothetical protein
MPKQPDDDIVDNEILVGGKACHRQIETAEMAGALKIKRAALNAR